MKNIINKKQLLFNKVDRRKPIFLGLYMMIVIAFSSCEDFVNIDPPIDQLTSEVIFTDVTSVKATILHVYSRLRDVSLTAGGTQGLSYLFGLYADELTKYGNNLESVKPFYENNLVANDNTISIIWNRAYNLIYATNNIIEGVQNTSFLTDDDKNQYLGEAYFLRAFIHFHLTNLFGEIPYVDKTDYVVNMKVSKLNEPTVYDKIIADLRKAESLLSTEYLTQAKVRPNKWVVKAVLAKVYLYRADWEMALNEVSAVINSGFYSLNPDIKKVFLKDSPETLWQFSPSFEGGNTIEAMDYIFKDGPPPTIAMSQSLINSFEANDARFSNWVGAVSDGQNTWYHPYKYKLNYLTPTSQEYSIVLRLAEMYLIACEANYRLGNKDLALVQLNLIRTRANLPSITDDTDFLNVLLHERRIELFSEHGNRFFDLKRMGKADEELSLVKPNWNHSDLYMPIPQSEIILNPNLEPQNEGY
ncbi:RagB/SusD family nutrient uptake outer membrane protein [Flavobacteriaceae bacterium F08102]|nr:RagB/SusD family nutrient uptake outer membrane protein [Flavobacteriaceae bacterium F08102]